MGPDLHHGLCAGLGQLLKGAAAGQRQPLRDCVRQDALALADLAHVIAELAQLVG